MTRTINEPMIGSLCTGYSGLDLGVAAALGGGRLAWCADPDTHVSNLLATRFPHVPNLGDIRTVNWTTIEPVDILTAGFPCQDISSAGRRAGIEKGKRSGLWADIVAALRLLRPGLLVVENVAALSWRNGGLHRVLADQAETGYDAIWRSVRASDIGAAHRRERTFILAWPHMPDRDAANAHRTRRKLQRTTRRQQTRRTDTPRADTTAANADRSRLPISRHPDRPESWLPHTIGMRDTDRLRPAPAHPDSLRRKELHPPNPTGRPITPRRGTRRQTEVAADATSDRRNQRLPQTARLQRRPHAALSGHPPTDNTRTREAVIAEPHIDWGTYTAAVDHWQCVLGRPVPFPTQPGRHGRPVLAPAFVEHLMGLPAGWVTDLPLPRTAQLRILGNGVVPQQAARAVSLLLADLAAASDPSDCECGQEARAA